MKPLISIIVPVYKVESYLEKCINSILTQSFKDFELILVDDGSPDECGKICDRYAKMDSRVKVIHKKNEGLSAARNTGLNIALGKYIGFVDSDDWIDENMYEILINLCVENDGDIVQCEFLKTSMEDSRINNSENNIVDIFDNFQGLRNLYNDKSISTVVSWNKLYKKELFNYVKFPVGKLHEDEFTTHELIYKAKKIIYTNKILYYYRQNPNSIMNSKFNKKRLDILDAMQKRLDFAELIQDKTFINETLKKYMMRLIYFYYKCKKELPEDEEIINDIKMKSNLIYSKYYLKSRVKAKSKIKYGIFYLSPNLYEHMNFK